MLNSHAPSAPYQVDASDKFLLLHEVDHLLADIIRGILDGTPPAHENAYIHTHETGGRLLAGSSMGAAYAKQAEAIRRDKYANFTPSFSVPDEADFAKLMQGQSEQDWVVFSALIADWAEHFEVAHALLPDELSVPAIYRAPAQALHAALSQPIMDLFTIFAFGRDLVARIQGFNNSYRDVPPPALSHLRLVPISDPREISHLFQPKTEAVSDA